MVKESRHRPAQTYKSVSFLIVTFSDVVVELLLPLSNAMMMMSNTAPPTTHIHGCTVIDSVVVLVVVVELLEVLSCANVTNCIISNINKVPKGNKKLVLNFCIK